MEDLLIDELQIKGYRYSFNPKTVFIPFNIEPTPTMKKLRDNYGWMIQTEII